MVTRIPLAAVSSATRRGLLFLPIFALGAAFRFADLGTIRLSYDSSYPMFEALRGLAGGGWSPVGQSSSVFLANPPLMNFIQALPLLVWRSPWAVCIFIVALNTLAIACVYRAARLLLGVAAGYIAALLFAINPWVVVLSRTTWVQSLVPLFVALIACSLWPTLATDRRSGRGVLIAGLAVTAMTQAYIQAWGILISIGLLLILFRASLPRRPLLIGSMVFVAALMVYGVGLLTNWDATQAQLSKFATGELHLTADGIAHAVRFVTGLDFDAQDRGLALGSDGLRVLSQIVYAALGLALIAGISLAVRAVWQKRRERRVGVVLLIWFFVPVLLMSVTSHPIHPHYLLLSNPAGHVLAAWGLLPFVRRPIGRPVIVAGLCGCAIVFGLNLHWDNMDAALHPTLPKLDGWTLESGTQVGNVVRQLTDVNQPPRRLVADTRPSLIGSLSGQDVRILNGLDYPSYVVLPGAEPLLYVLFDTAIEPEALGSRVEMFPDRSLQFVDGARVAFVRAMPYDRPAALALPHVTIDWPSAAGLTLLGYTLSGPIRPGGAIECVTYWRVDDIRAGRDEWIIGAFYRVVDRQEQLVISVDGHGQYARRWQLGDVYVERTLIPLPADMAVGDYSLKIGLYDSVHAQVYEFQPSGRTQDSFDILLSVSAARFEKTSD